VRPSTAGRKPLSGPLCLAAPTAVIYAEAAAAAWVATAMAAVATAAVATGAAAAVMMVAVSVLRRCLVVV